MQISPCKLGLETLFPDVWHQAENFLYADQDCGSQKIIYYTALGSPKNVMQSNTSQNHLTCLGTLASEPLLAWHTDLNTVIELFCFKNC